MKKVNLYPANNPACALEEIDDYMRSQSNRLMYCISKEEVREDLRALEALLEKNGAEGRESFARTLEHRSEMIDDSAKKNMKYSMGGLVLSFLAIGVANAFPDMNEYVRTGLGLFAQAGVPVSVAALLTNCYDLYRNSEYGNSLAQKIRNNESLLEN